MWSIAFISIDREMKLPEPLRKHLTTALVTAIVGLFAFFGAKVYHDISGPFLVYILPAISNKTLLSAGLLGWLLAILLAAWVIYLHRDKGIDARFDKFDPQLGLWTHKTMPGHFCARCKSDHRESPVKETDEGWSCPVCGKWGLKKDPPPQGMKRPNWVTDVNI